MIIVHKLTIFLAAVIASVIGAGAALVALMLAGFVLYACFALVTSIAAAL